MSQVLKFAFASLVLCCSVGSFVGCGETTETKTDTPAETPAETTPAETKAE
ncbi:MAG TPA: hypothetical protein PLI18_13820 [Pirellulaceae bacterium]|nr:hypothetical protein [Pirellulaceae bacterium]